MTLRMNATLAARNVDVSFTVGPAETIAVMGPNGSGKSSVVQILAGLLKPDAGHATLGGRTLFQLSPGTIWLPPHVRELGVLAQDPLLFPQLSILDNVAFGPRSQGLKKEASREAARHWLGAVDAVELSSRLPAQLSGGQAQRVALARALATDPALLLLDEPMAALDVNSAPFLRTVLKRVLTDRRAIIVTHSVLDALLLADRIIVMERGKIVESGPTSAVLAHPRSAFAASLAGLNVLRGTLNGSRLVTDDGVLVTGRLSGGAHDRQDASGATEPPLLTGSAQAGLAAFPPSAVSVFLTPPHGSPRNSFKVRVTEMESQGDHIRVRANHLGADISPAAAAELALTPGAEAYFVVKAAEVALYPA